LFIPQETYKHGEPWCNDIDWGKLLIRPPELTGNPTSSHFIAKEKELGEGNDEYGLRSIVFVHTSK
jgi:hypothetical protein